MTAALLTVGCGSNGATSPGSAPDGVAQAMRVDLPLPGGTTAPAQMTGLTLPIDAYKFSDTESVVVAGTFTTLFNRCMAKLGFTEPSPHLTSSRSADFMRTRYGPADDVAAADGYHFRRDQALGVQQTGTGRDSKPSVSAAESAASGGCATQAKQAVTAGGAVYGEPDLVIAIDSEGFSRSQTDPRVVSAFAAWSNCMKQSGYSYKTPNEPLHDPRWVDLPAASRPEIETAQADVRCKRTTDVVGIWYAVESAMQQAAISQHAEELATVKAGEARELKIAAAVLGDGVLTGQ